MLKIPFKKMRPKDISSVFKFEKPGPLRHEVQLALNTFEPQLLFMGNVSKGYVGLLRFTNALFLIWEAASEDDPYADYYLWRVHNMITSLSQNLKAIMQQYENLLSKTIDHPNMQLHLLASEKPVIRSVWFKTPYGYMATGLLADFDTLLCLALTAYRMGAIPYKVYKALRDEWAFHIATLFRLPSEWQPLGLTRADMVADTVVAQEAESLMGALPEGFVNKQKRSFLAPDIKHDTYTETSSNKEEVSTLL